MPLEERKIEQLLLKECRSLIQLSVLCSAIKVCSSSLYVGDRNHGKVQNNQFVVCAGVADNVIMTQENIPIVKMN